MATTAGKSVMDKLMEGVGSFPGALKRAQKVEGTVTAISKKMVLIDIGAKTEGVVTGEDLAEAYDVLKELKVGDKVSAYVKFPENDQGQIILTLKQAADENRWYKYKKIMEEEKEVDVTGLEVNKGGMVVKIGDIRGFVPTSQFGEKFLGNMESLLNKTFKVRVIEVDKDQNRLIFSEKLVSDFEALAKKGEALEMVTVGDKFEGTVSGIMPFGVFVTVNVPMKDKEEVAKVEGLIHISEISWEKVEDPNVMFKVGQEVKVQVIGIDKGAGKLNLSIKQMSGDPWSDIETRYAVGTKHSGKAYRIAPYGIFVNFEKGVDGLIHISKKPADKEFKVGDKVEVFVESLDVKARRMSLGVVLTEVPVAYK
ncbi:MAG: 30S ribosomal protein S1 [Candidatus Collierbacteria bacterium GW2011_GWB1_44_6]|uniref:30S ribosomal protein S1 n=2 Tax=Candidatus Collieribacteriota TaxID=1752725 RepID=A0A0G1MKJ3_9BACT|nr:MAG: 30S ribosomal protein S1 [Candidatus Collierbacteria bacterium GW2011_GWC2_43_12]KKT72534.1 MAG: 30S ribosomal protein S1 [Candidatus Collierbacteria bacterium GW2011_GWB1_44_6]